VLEVADIEHFAAQNRIVASATEHMP
jgi:hypothetical protein